MRLVEFYFQYLIFDLGIDLDAHFIVINAIVNNSKKSFAMIMKPVSEKQIMCFL